MSIIPDVKEVQFAPAIFKNQLFDNKSIIDTIKEVVANFYEVPMLAYEDKGRKRKYVKVRQVAGYVIKKIAGQRISLQEIGVQMGKKDHATILYGVRKVEELSSVEKEFKAELNEIMRIIGVTPIAADFGKNIEPDMYYLNLNDIKVLKINNNCSITFSGITESVIRQIREQFFKGPAITLRKFENTGLYILQKDEQPKENEQNELNSGNNDLHKSIQ